MMQTVLLRLAYLGVTNALAMLRLLPMSDRAKDAEILALRIESPSSNGNCTAASPSSPRPTGLPAVIAVSRTELASLLHAETSDVADRMGLDTGAVVKRPFELRQLLRASRGVPWREHLAGVDLGAGRVRRRIAWWQAGLRRGSSTLPAARRFPLLNGYGGQARGAAHGEIGSAGGIRASLLPKPVIRRGADGVVMSGVGRCWTAPSSFLPPATFRVNAGQRFA